LWGFIFFELQEVSLSCADHQASSVIQVFESIFGIVSGSTYCGDTLELTAASAVKEKLI